jgi:Zn-dependent protease with chaperone function
MTLALAIAVLAAIALPHRMALDRASAKAAIAVWMAALALRALAGVVIGLVAVFVVPTTQLFQAATHWCLHAVLPLLTADLRISGHAVGDAATLVPGFAILVSLSSAIWALAHAARAVQKALRKEALGAGPHGSTIVGGPGVDVAAAGLARPRIVVSAGALLALDDAELRAGIEHERGHVSGQHRFILIFAQLCQAFGALIPRSGSAVRELAFQLERDADQYALAQTGDQGALVRAICKAAGAAPSNASLMSLSGGSRVARRVNLLMATASEAQLAKRAPRYLAVLMVLLALAVASTVPGLALAGAEAFSATPASVHCAG